MNFHQKLKMIATKVSKEDFYFVDMAQPYLKQPWESLVRIRMKFNKNKNLVNQFNGKQDTRVTRFCKILSFGLFFKVPGIFFLQEKSFVASIFRV
jgi:hypothetical protein